MRLLKAGSIECHSVYRRSPSLLVFDLPVKGDVRRIPGNPVLVGIIRVVLLGREVNEERRVGAYGLVAMSDADRYAEDDVVAGAEVMGLCLAARRRAFAHVIKTNFAGALDNNEVIFLPLVVVPGADDARVVERNIALTELREELVRTSNELHEVATFIDIRLQLLDLHSFDHVAVFPVEYGIASARRFPYCCL